MDDIISLFVNASRFAAQKELKRFTRFLDPAQANDAKRIAREHGVSFETWGGYDQAERVLMNIRGMTNADKGVELTEAAKAKRYFINIPR